VSLWFKKSVQPIPDHYRKSSFFVKFSVIRVVRVQKKQLRKSLLGSAHVGNIYAAAALNNHIHFMEYAMKKIILFTITLFLITACSPSSQIDLSGEWKLVSYGNTANPTPALPDVDTSIKFENGQMNGNVGCNGFGGAYEMQGDKITFSGVMSTMMYCEKTSIQEQGVLAILVDNIQLQVKMNGNDLTITSADGSSTLKLTRK
jgi:heat shock protein HslJ